jgi:Fur family ferric uptake transcriptional regulator
MSNQANQAKTLPCGRPAEKYLPPRTSLQLEKCKNQLKAYLLKNGLKYTEQRWKIAELILSTQGHLNAQALVDQVKKKHSEIGAATVYRSIKVLCDALILRESLTDTQGQTFYELFDDHHHDHIVCIDCGQIFEFYDQKLETLQDAVVGKMKFRGAEHRHVVYGRCEYRMTRGSEA